MAIRMRVLWILSSIMDAYIMHMWRLRALSLMMSLLMIWWVSRFWVLWCLRLMICGESHDSESYDVSVLWSVVSLMSLMICASYVGTEKSSMNDDKKDQHMDSASSAGISLQDFLNDYACNIQCITWGAMIGRVVWGAMIARVPFAEKICHDHALTCS